MRLPDLLAAPEETTTAPAATARGREAGGRGWAAPEDRHDGTDADCPGMHERLAA